MAKLYSTSFMFLVLLLLAAVESGVCQVEPQQIQCVTSWDCPGEKRAGDKACKAKCSGYPGGYGFCRTQSPNQRVCLCSYNCPP